MNLCVIEANRGKRHEKQYNGAENQAQSSPIQARISQTVVMQRGEYTEFSTVERIQWKIIVVHNTKDNSVSENPDRCVSLDQLFQKQGKLKLYYYMSLMFRKCCYPLPFMHECLYEACIKQYECLKHRRLQYLALGITEPEH